MEVKYTQTGFTLIEMIAVITIMAILAVFAASKWSTNPNINAQAQQLAADIRYTQSLAMTHGSRYRLTLTAPNTYAIATITGSVVTDTVLRNTTTSFNTGINFGTITNLPNNVIAFDGRGNLYIDNNATTPLTSTAIINLTNGSEVRQIQITPAGQVQVK